MKEIRKLFVSYRSIDSKKVDPIVARLRSLDYDVWQDKDSIPVGQDWWEAICEGIYACDVFIFMVSRESVKSHACIAELSYAHELNLPIIPFVIQGEWVYNEGGKYNIAFWDEIPPELQDDDNRAQFLFYEGANFVDKLREGFAKILEKNPPRLPTDPPPDPRHAADASNDPVVIYDEACDFAYRSEFKTAEKLFRKLISRGDPMFGDFSHKWVEIIRQYKRFQSMFARASTRKIAQTQWVIYIQKFPNEFIDVVFDPDNIAESIEQEQLAAEQAERERLAAEETKRRQQAAEQAQQAERDRLAAEQAKQEQQATQQAERDRLAAEQAERKRQAAAWAERQRQNQPPRTKPQQNAQRVEDILPQPFAWIDIPAGQVTLEGRKGSYIPEGETRTFDVPAFQIAKYPITNVQFAKFIEAGGYDNQRWWTDAGWNYRQKEGWQLPRYWNNDEYNSETQPIVGVSWFEAIAFCNWLNQASGMDNITLPTDQQWQRAAQGDDGRTYPWGNDWDCKRCNNPVKPCDSNVTTPVTQYEGKGDSPFGVVDMSGNVWEWCLTDYENKTNDVNISANTRVLRGGSWFSYVTDYFRCDYRDWFDPSLRSFNGGFRLSRFN